MGNKGNKKKKLPPEKPIEKKPDEPNLPAITPIRKIKATSLSLEIKVYSPFSKEIIEDVIAHPDLPNSIIIAFRSGNISEISGLAPPFKESLKTQNLYSFSRGVYSLILLKKNDKKLCAGLENGIFILKLKMDGNHSLEKESELSCQEEAKINSLLELENGNIISAGKNIILWKIDKLKKYTKVSSIQTPNSILRIVNLVEFPILNTIIATQEESHNIYVLKNEEKSISLIKTKGDIPSIWYKGSAEKLTKNGMLLIGKFEINVIDANNGEKISRYPGIDKGCLLNFTQNYKDDYWIVTDFMGRYLEFYQQDENDLIYLDKQELEENEYIGWFNRLVKINDECFVSINHYAKIIAFKIDFKK